MTGFAILKAEMKNLQNPQRIELITFDQTFSHVEKFDLHKLLHRSVVHGGAPFLLFYLLVLTLTGLQLVAKYAV